jgi:hypothetical protein
VTTDLRVALASFSSGNRPARSIVGVGRGSQRVLSLATLPRPRGASFMGPALDSLGN